MGCCFFGGCSQDSHGVTRIGHLLGPWPCFWIHFALNVLRGGCLQTRSIFVTWTYDVACGFWFWSLGCHLLLAQEQWEWGTLCQCHSTHTWMHSETPRSVFQPLNFLGNLHWFVSEAMHWQGCSLYFFKGSSHPPHSKWLIALLSRAMGFTYLTHCCRICWTEFAI